MIVHRIENERGAGPYQWALTFEAMKKLRNRYGAKQYYEIYELAHDVTHPSEDFGNDWVKLIPVNYRKFGCLREDDIIRFFSQKVVDFLAKFHTTYYLATYEVEDSPYIGRCQVMYSSKNASLVSRKTLSRWLKERSHESS